jgi:hypothetical protein
VKITDVNLRVKGRKNKNIPVRVYNYTIKNLNSLRFDDLVDIMGIDVACKLLNLFSGGSMYIPKKSSIRKDFLHAIIRKEAEHLKEVDKIGIVKLVEMLSAKFGYSKETIYQILGYKNSNALPKGKFIQKKKIDTVRDENLLSLLKSHYEKLKRNNLI